MDSVITTIDACRICKAKNLFKIIDFGTQPLANAFLTKNQCHLPEQFYPLDVFLCPNCGLVQLGHIVSPQLLFRNYVYVSSTSKVFIKHFTTFAELIKKRFALTPKDLVVDIGSNDGILLRPFKRLKMRVLGVEPAKKIAALANKNGIQTMADFFDLKLTRKIVKIHGQAKVITASNVFAHIDNLDEIITSLQMILKLDGVFVIEAPHLVTFLKNNLFDTVYHEHLSYLALKPLKRLFCRFDMEIFDVDKIPTHGGSIRIYIKQKKANYPVSENVERLLAEEQNERIFSLSTYQTFNRRILENKSKLLAVLIRLKNQGKSLAGYGAPAKGNTLLNFFGIGNEILDFIVDDSIWKQGMYSPGKHIPIVSPKTIYTKKTDYLLLLAWNFAPSIIKAHDKYRHGGGKFIIPVPQVKIIS